MIESSATYPIAVEEDASAVAALREALAEANIPTLLMVLVQLTGDRHWLADPYRPQRTKGMSDNDTGGLPPEVQELIRGEAFDAIRRWRAGELTPMGLPPEELFVEMMSVCVGEPVPPEYAPMMAEEMGFRARDVTWDTSPDPEALSRFHVLVIGAGVSGLCTAFKLEQAGIPYTVIEKNDAVGGTWLDNRYPGCGVDTPSHLYSYSFAQQEWPHYYSKRQDLHDYLERCATEFGVRHRIQLRTEVRSARYDAVTHTWTVMLRGPDGTEREVVANVVISAVGQLNRPSVPNIPGRDTFAGPAFHSAQWPSEVDVRGKRVAVVGTGASAMQLVPAIVDEVAQLTVFQRSPQWTAPSENYRREVTDGIKLLMKEVPLYAAWYRFRLAWAFNDKVHASLQVDPDWPHPERSVNAVNDGHRRFFTDYMLGKLGDRSELIPKVLPDYPPFGKRMLIDNGWFEAITQDHVELVTESVAEIRPHGLITADGAEHEADVIVFATGFDSRKMLAPMEIRGRSGRTLRETWGDDDAHAYLGLAIPDFPNFFCLYGPNTNLGHGGSLIFLTECGVRYIMEIIQAMVSGGLAAVECRLDVHDAYNARVDAAHGRMIWTHTGMDTWYRNARGRIVTNSPWRVVDYWQMTRRARLEEFHVEGAS
ncbi:MULTISPECIES: NAD(P)/FAD-dependent oxidoreductase [unclassified Micromonospora]|uniref:flavin-containing monooxygenase n=1 Tax=unclassified Micromonospora TaxID=2617518 RepID=UPI0033AD73B8